ncbi:MAG TPA: hypothetical protein VF941_12210, partial [Clostridia bacterium]
KYDSKYADRCTLTFTIPDIDNMNLLSKFLTLGYADECYDDNCYDYHDDGELGQCKGVGAAYVDITIVR